MTRTFPTDLNQFIQDEFQPGGYADEDAVFTAALEVLPEVRQRHAVLRGRVQESLTEALARSLLTTRRIQSLISRINNFPLLFFNDGSNFVSRAALSTI